MEALIPRILMPWKVFVQTKDELFGEDWLQCYAIEI
jgi:hypothetical protein